MRKFQNLLLFLMCFGVFISQIAAQAPTGTIEGNISDPSNAIVAGATVTLTENSTARSLTAATNDEGFYSFRSLQPGIYTVKVERQGFSTTTVENVVVQVGQVARTDIALKIGAQSEIVQVELSSSEVQVDTTRQTVDGVITGRQITGLPLNERNFLDLAALQPGVTVADGDIIDPTKVNAFRAVRVNGGSGTGTRVQIDGIDVTDETVGSTVANFSTDAVQEFQLSRSSFDLSTSLTTSGAVSIISRSGSNKFSGSGFYFGQDEKFDARPKFLTSKPSFDRQQVGYRFGGPILKNKLFFFSNFERLKQNDLGIFRSGDFPSFTGEAAIPIEARYALHRLDWAATDTVKVFYVHNYNDDSSTANGGSGDIASPFQNVDWTNTHVFGTDFSINSLANSFRLGFVNFNNRIESQELGVFPFPRTPQGVAFSLQVGDLVVGPNSLAPQRTDQHNTQFKYDGSYTISNHVFRFGGEINRIVLGGFANFAGPLTTTGDINSSTSSNPLDYNLDDFSTGPNAGFFTARPAHGLPFGGKFNTRYGAYVGDAWKIRRNLTFNLGVRYNYESNFFASTEVPPITELERYGVGKGAGAKFPKNAFSPQVGFAWDVFGDGKTSVRGGFYLAYEGNIFNNALFDEFARIAPGIGPTSLSSDHIVGPDGAPINIGAIPGCAAADIAVGDYTCLTGRPIRTVLPFLGLIHTAVQNAYSNLGNYNPTGGPSEFQNTDGVTSGGQFPGDYKIPYSMQFNIGFQRELFRGHVLSVDYVRQRSIGLPLILGEYEKRRDARFFNEAAARSSIGTRIGQPAANVNPTTIQAYLIANPGRTIANFSLANDTIFPGRSSDVTRARLITGGLSTYQGLQISLNGRISDNTFDFLSVSDKPMIRGFSYTLGYSLSRTESTNGSSRPEFFSNPLDNNNINGAFGPATGLDRTHNLTISAGMEIIGGFRLDQLYRFATPTPLDLTVPISGGANALFTSDINGDGGHGGTPRADLLPGTQVGDFGRRIRSLSELNQVITAYNNNNAGKLTPAGQRFVAAGIFSEAQLRALGAISPFIPLVPEGNPDPFEKLFRMDLRISRPIRLWKETWSLEPSFSIFNVFNNAPRASYSGLGLLNASTNTVTNFGTLNYNYATEADRARLDETRGLLSQIRRRQLQFGIRFTF